MLDNLRWMDELLGEICVCVFMLYKKESIFFWSSNILYFKYIYKVTSVILFNILGLLGKPNKLTVKSIIWHFCHVPLISSESSNLAQIQGKSTTQGGEYQVRIDPFVNSVHLLRNLIGYHMSLHSLVCSWEFQKPALWDNWQSEELILSDITWTETVIQVWLVKH